jgi:Zn-dependent protease with chaperone function
MPAKLAKCIAALAVIILLYATASAEHKNGTTISVFSDERGRTSVNYWVWSDKPLDANQLRAIERAIGQPLETLDHDEDDGEGWGETAGSDSGDEDLIVYTAERNFTLRRTGLEFEGVVDLVELGVALRECGIGSVEIVTTNPKKVDPSASDSAAQSLTPIRDRDSRIYSVDLAASRPSDLLVRIVYGDRGPSAAWRLGTLAAVLLSITGAVVWLQRRALQAVREGTGGSQLDHIRFLNVVASALPVCWWMAFSITDFRRLAYYRLGFAPFGYRMLAEGLVGFALPCLVFWTCALIWRPALRALPVIASTSPVGLFVGSFLPGLCVCGGGFYFFEYRIEVGAALWVAGLALQLLHRKLLVKPADRKIYALLAPELRQRAFDLAHRAKVKLKEIFVLPETGHFISNAFARSDNTIWLSEYMLRRLSRAEVDSIVAHELGHLKRSHPALRMIPIFGSLFLGGICALFFRAMGYEHVNLFFPTSIAVGMFGFFLLARRLEYSADQLSVRINGDPEAAITSLVRITRDGRPSLSWGKLDEKLLTHPSTARRAARIARKSGIPKERLAELLNAPEEPEEGYSLAAGSSTTPAAADETVAPGASVSVKGRKHRTGYSALPFVYGLLVSYTLWLLALLEPDMGVFNRSLLAPPTGPYYLAGVVVFGILVWALTARLQRKKLAMASPFTFVDASASQFPGLDLKSVSSHTGELESLGFVISGDYCAETAGSRDQLKQFLRVFISEEHKCWAIITQVTTDTLAVTKVGCSFASTLGDGYAIYTSNAQPSPALYASRLPREVRVHVPGADPGDLLSVHIAKRERIAATAGLVPLRVGSGDAYLAHELDRVVERQRLLPRRNAWLFLWRVDRFNRKPKMEWGG